MDLNALLALPANGLVIFLLVLVRSSAIFLTAPVLGNASVPVQVKIGLSFLLAIIFTPFLMHQPLKFPIDSAPDLLLAVIQEVAVGLMIGLLAQFLFVAIQFAGQLVGIQMGFGMASVFDPTFRTSISVTAQFYLVIGVLVFLLLDGHQWILIALQRSFQAIPLGTFTLDGRAMGVLLQASDNMFWSALTIMAPVLGVLILTEVALAIVARIMPQMNIFMASFPVKIGLGVVTMALSFPMVIHYFGTLTEQTFSDILRFLTV